MREPRLTASVPTLPSLDFDETETFYAKLGFVVDFRDITVMALRRDGARLHFWLTANERIPKSTSCWIEVDGIEDFYAAVSQIVHVRRREGLSATSWGTREFSISDPHGNLIRFSEDDQRA